MTCTEELIETGSFNGLSINISKSAHFSETCQQRLQQGSVDLTFFLC